MTTRTQRHAGRFGVEYAMRLLCLVLVGVIAAPAAISPRVAAAEPQHDAGAANQQAAAEQVFVLANQARMQAGVGRLQWDPALAAAALKHCLRMAQEGPIAHRYGGEADLSARAAQAGAHFSVIEENVAIGP